MKAVHARGSPSRAAWRRVARAVLVSVLACACSKEQAPPLPAGAAARRQETGTKQVAANQASEPAPQRTRVWFADVTQAWGLDFTHDAGLTPEKHLPETMGAGAALADFDNDGDLDIYLVQGGPMRLAGKTPGTFVDPPGPLPPNRTFRNQLAQDKQARFVDVTKNSKDGAHTGYGMGVAVGDVHGDGNLDLYVTNLGPDVLLAGDGALAFADQTRASGLGDERWTSAATFFDADGDGDLDLYVTGYVQVDYSKPLWCGGREPGWRSACHPDAYEGLPDRFFKNRGDGTFEEATKAAGLQASSGKGLGVVACDFDGDGDLDVYTANDSVENRLWENLGNGTFRDATLLSGTGVDERGATEAGMGLATGDFDSDLDLDLFVTNFDDESNTLYEQKRPLVFRDATLAVGLEAASLPWVGFGTVLADFDHDSDLDLAVVNGHIIDNIHLTHDGKTHAQFAQLFENKNKRFVELRAEAGDLRQRPLVARGLYSGDIDGDLDLDLLVTQCGGPAILLENRLDKGAAVVIEGFPPDSVLRLVLDDGRVLLREAGPEISYFGASAGAVHAGLAGSRLTKIEYRTPSKESGSIVLEPALARGRVRARRGEGTWQLEAEQTLGR